MIVCNSVGVYFIFQISTVSAVPIFLLVNLIYACHFYLVEDKQNTIIHCDNYGEAGAVNFYSKQKYTQAVSMNADYIYWYPLDKMEIKNVILVKNINDEDKNREREKAFFDSVTLMGEISNQYAREKGTAVYLLKGAKISVNDILREEIRKNKNNF